MPLFYFPDDDTQRDVPQGQEAEAMSTYGGVPVKGNAVDMYFPDDTLRTVPLRDIPRAKNEFGASFGKQAVAGPAPVSSFREQFPNWIGPEPGADFANTEAGRDYLKIQEDNSKGPMGFWEGADFISVSSIPYYRDVDGMYDAMSALNTLRKLKENPLNVSPDDVTKMNVYLAREDRLANAGTAGSVGHTIKASMMLGLEAIAAFFTAGGGAAAKLTIEGGKATAKAGIKQLASVAAKEVRQKLADAGTKAALQVFGKETAAKAQEAIARKGAQSLFSVIKDRSAKEASAIVAGKVGGAAAVITGGGLLTMAPTTLIQLGAGGGTTKTQQVKQLYEELAAGGDASVETISLLNALSDDFIQYSSEMMGSYLMKAPGLSHLDELGTRMRAGIKRWSDKALAQGTAPEVVAQGEKKLLGWSSVAAALAWANARKGLNFDQMMETFKTGAWDGVMGEFMEERAGGFLSGLFGLQGDNAGIKNAIDQAIPDAQQAKVEFLSFSAPLVFTGALHSMINFGKLDKTAAINQTLSQATENALRNARNGEDVKGPLLDESQVQPALRTVLDDQLTYEGANGWMNGLTDWALGVKFSQKPGGGFEIVSDADARFAAGMVPMLGRQMTATYNNYLTNMREPGDSDAVAQEKAKQFAIAHGTELIRQQAASVRIHTQAKVDPATGQLSPELDETDELVKTLNDAGMIVFERETNRRFLKPQSRFNGSRITPAQLAKLQERGIDPTSFSRNVVSAAQDLVELPRHVTEAAEFDALVANVAAEIDATADEIYMAKNQLLSVTDAHVISDGLFMKAFRGDTLSPAEQVHLMTLTGIAPSSPTAFKDLEQKLAFNRLAYAEAKDDAIRAGDRVTLRNSVGPGNTPYKVMSVSDGKVVVQQVVDREGRDVFENAPTATYKAAELTKVKPDRIFFTPVGSITDTLDNLVKFHETAGYFDADMSYKDKQRSVRERAAPVGKDRDGVTPLYRIGVQAENTPSGRTLFLHGFEPYGVVEDAGLEGAFKRWAKFSPTMRKRVTDPSNVSVFRDLVLKPLTESLSKVDAGAITDAKERVVLAHLKAWTSTEEGRIELLAKLTGHQTSLDWKASKDTPFVAETTKAVELIGADTWENTVVPALETFWKDEVYGGDAARFDQWKYQSAKKPATEDLPRSKVEAKPAPAAKPATAKPAAPAEKPATPPAAKPATPPAAKPATPPAAKPATPPAAKPTETPAEAEAPPKAGEELSDAASAKAIDDLLSSEEKTSTPAAKPDDKAAIKQALQKGRTKRGPTQSLSDKPPKPVEGELTPEPRIGDDDTEKLDKDLLADAAKDANVITELTAFADDQAEFAMPARDAENVVSHITRAMGREGQEVEVARELIAPFMTVSVKAGAESEDAIVQVQDGSPLALTANERAVAVVKQFTRFDKFIDKVEQLDGAGKRRLMLWATSDQTKAEMSGPDAPGKSVENFVAYVRGETTSRSGRLVRDLYGAALDLAGGYDERSDKFQRVARMLQGHMVSLQKAYSTFVPHVAFNAVVATGKGFQTFVANRFDVEDSLTARVTSHLQSHSRQTWQGFRKEFMKITGMKDENFDPQKPTKMPETPAKGEGPHAVVPVLNAPKMEEVMKLAARIAGLPENIFVNLRSEGALNWNPNVMYEQFVTGFFGVSSERTRLFEHENNRIAFLGPRTLDRETGPDGKPATTAEAKAYAEKRLTSAIQNFTEKVYTKGVRKDAEFTPLQQVARLTANPYAYRMLYDTANGDTALGWHQRDALLAALKPYVEKELPPGSTLANSFATVGSFTFEHSPTDIVTEDAGKLLPSDRERLARNFLRQGWLDLGMFGAKSEVKMVRLDFHRPGVWARELANYKTWYASQPEDIRKTLVPPSDLDKAGLVNTEASLADWYNDAKTIKDKTPRDARLRQIDDAIYAVFFPKMRRLVDGDLEFYRGKGGYYNGFGRRTGQDGTGGFSPEGTLKMVVVSNPDLAKTFDGQYLFADESMAQKFVQSVGAVLARDPNPYSVKNHVKFTVNTADGKRMPILVKVNGTNVDNMRDGILMHEAKEAGAEDAKTGTPLVNDAYANLSDVLKKTGADFLVFKETGVKVGNVPALAVDGRGTLVPDQGDLKAALTSVPGDAFFVSQFLTGPLDPYYAKASKQMLFNLLMLDSAGVTNTLDLDRLTLQELNAELDKLNNLNDVDWILKSLIGDEQRQEEDPILRDLARGLKAGTLTPDSPLVSQKMNELRVRYIERTMQRKDYRAGMQLVSSGDAREVLPSEASENGGTTVSWARVNLGRAKGEWYDDAEGNPAGVVFRNPRKDNFRYGAFKGVDTLARKFIGFDSQEQGAAFLQLVTERELAQARAKGELPRLTFADMFVPVRNAEGGKAEGQVRFSDKSIAAPVGAPDIRMGRDGRISLQTLRMNDIRNVENVGWVVGGSLMISTRIPSDAMQSHPVVRAYSNFGGSANFIALHEGVATTKGADKDGDKEYVTLMDGYNFDEGRKGDREAWDHRGIYNRKHMLTTDSLMEPTWRAWLARPTSVIVDMYKKTLGELRDEQLANPASALVAKPKHFNSFAFTGFMQSMALGGKAAIGMAAKGNQTTDFMVSTGVYMTAPLDLAMHDGTKVRLNRTRDGVNRLRTSDKDSWMLMKNIAGTATVNLTADDEKDFHLAYAAMTSRFLGLFVSAVRNLEYFEKPSDKSYQERLDEVMPTIKSLLTTFAKAPWVRDFLAMERTKNSIYTPEAERPSLSAIWRDVAEKHVTSDEKARIKAKVDEEAAGMYVDGKPLTGEALTNFKRNQTRKLLLDPEYTAIGSWHRLYLLAAEEMVLAEKADLQAVDLDQTARTVGGFHALNDTMSKKLSFLDTAQLDKSPLFDYGRRVAARIQDTFVNDWLNSPGGRYLMNAFFDAREVMNPRADDYNAASRLIGQYVRVLAIEKTTGKNFRQIIKDFGATLASTFTRNHPMAPWLHVNKDGQLEIVPKYKVGGMDSRDQNEARDAFDALPLEEQAGLLTYQLRVYGSSNSTRAGGFMPVLGQPDGSFTARLNDAATKVVSSDAWTENPSSLKYFDEFYNRASGSVKKFMDILPEGSSKRADEFVEKQAVKEKTTQSLADNVKALTAAAMVAATPLNIQAGPPEALSSALIAKYEGAKNTSRYKDEERNGNWEWAVGPGYRLFPHRKAEFEKATGANFDAIRSGAAKLTPAQMQKLIDLTGKKSLGDALHIAPVLKNTSPATQAHAAQLTHGAIFPITFPNATKALREGDWNRVSYELLHSQLYTNPVKETRGWVPRLKDAADAFEAEAKKIVPTAAERAAYKRVADRLVSHSLSDTKLYTKEIGDRVHTRLRAERVIRDDFEKKHRIAYEEIRKYHQEIGWSPDPNDAYTRGEVFVHNMGAYNEEMKNGVFNDPAKMAEFLRDLILRSDRVDRLGEGTPIRDQAKVSTYTVKLGAKYDRFRRQARYALVFRPGKLSIEWASRRDNFSGRVVPGEVKRVPVYPYGKEAYLKAEGNAHQAASDLFELESRVERLKEANVLTRALLDRLDELGQNPEVLSTLASIGQETSRLSTLEGPEYGLVADELERMQGSVLPLTPPDFLSYLTEGERALLEQAKEFGYLSYAQDEFGDMDEIDVSEELLGFSLATNPRIGPYEAWTYGQLYKLLKDTAPFEAVVSLQVRELFRVLRVAYTPPTAGELAAAKQRSAEADQEIKRHEPTSYVETKTPDVVQAKSPGVNYLDSLVPTVADAIDKRDTSEFPHNEFAIRPVIGEFVVRRTDGKPLETELRALGRLLDEAFSIVQRQPLDKPFDFIAPYERAFPEVPVRYGENAARYEPAEGEPSYKSLEGLRGVDQKDAVRISAIENDLTEAKNELDNHLTYAYSEREQLSLAMRQFELFYEASLPEETRSRLRQIRAAREETPPSDIGEHSHLDEEERRVLGYLPVQSPEEEKALRDRFAQLPTELELQTEEAVLRAKIAELEREWEKLSPKPYVASGTSYSLAQTLNNIVYRQAESYAYRVGVKIQDPEDLRENKLFRAKLSELHKRVKPFRQRLANATTFETVKLTARQMEKARILDYSGMERLINTAWNSPDTYSRPTELREPMKPVPTPETPKYDQLGFTLSLESYYAQLRRLNAPLFYAGSPLAHKMMFEMKNILSDLVDAEDLYQAYMADIYGLTSSNKLWYVAPDKSGRLVVDKKLGFEDWLNGDREMVRRLQSAVTALQEGSQTIVYGPQPADSELPDQESVDDFMKKFDASSTKAKLLKAGRTADQLDPYKMVREHQKQYDQWHTDLNGAMAWAFTEEPFFRYWSSYAPHIYGHGFKDEKFLARRREWELKVRQAEKAQTMWLLPSDTVRVYKQAEKIPASTMQQRELFKRIVKDRFTAGHLKNMDQFDFGQVDRMNAAEANQVILKHLEALSFDRYRLGNLALVPQELATIRALRASVKNYRGREFSGREVARNKDYATYAAAYEAGGLAPATMDALELRRMYVNDIQTSMINKAILNGMLLYRDEEGKPLVIAVPDAASLADDPYGVIRKEIMEENAKNLYDMLGLQYVPGSDPAAAVSSLVHNKLAALKDYVRMESPYESVAEFMVLKGDSHKIMRILIETQKQLFMGSVEVLQPLMKLTQWTKSLAVSFSLFFHMSGFESLIAGTGLGKNQILNPMGGFKNFRDAKAQMQEVARALKNNDPFWMERISKLRRAGAKLDVQAITDEPRGSVDQDIEKWAESISLRMGPEAGAKAKNLIRAMTGRGIADWTFKQFFPAIKVWAAWNLYEQTHEKRPDLSQDQVLRTIAPIINDAYGGQNWFRYLWATPRTMQLLNLLLFAPNWSISAWNIAGGGLVTGKLFRNYMSQTNKDFVFKTNWPAMMAIVLAAIPNALQAAIYGVAQATGNGDPDDRPFTFQNEQGRRTYIDITPLVRSLPGYEGQPTGQRRQYARFGKQAYEVLHGWLTEAPDQFLRKMSMPAKYVLQNLTGKSPGSDWDLEFQGKGLGGWFFTDEPGLGALATSRLGYAAQMFMPMSVVSAVKNPETWATALFVPTSKGESAGRATQKLVEVFNTYADQEEWNKVRAKGRAVQLKLDALAPAIVDAARRNGYDTEKIVNTAKSVVLGRLYKLFYEALDKNDTATMDQVARSILRVGGTLKGLKNSVNTKRVNYGKEGASAEELAAIEAAFK